MSFSSLWLAFGTRPFRAREAAAAMGVTKASTTLSRYLQEGTLSRLGRGVYRFNTQPDTIRIGAKLIQIERDRQAEFFPQVAAGTIAAWRKSGRLVETAPGRWKLRPGGKRYAFRRVS